MTTLTLVSKVTRLFGPGDAGNLQYECFGCGQGFKLEYYSCPECGSFRVERTEWVTD